MSDDTSTDGATPPPVLCVVRGNPSPEDLAVIAAVLSAASQEAGSTADPAPVGTWAAYWRQARPPLRPGPGAWRASARPH